MGRNHEASHKNGELQRALLELPMRTPTTYDALAGALGVSRSTLCRDPRALELAGPHRSGEVR